MIWQMVRNDGVSAHQVCLVHMHRRTTASMGKYPKDLRVQELKRLADHVWLIEFREALLWWRKKLRHWINESFTFLRYPTMPKTSNELEAQFGHLAKRWLAYRGLRKDRWESFMKWCVYIYNNEKLTHKRKKKG